MAAPASAEVTVVKGQTWEAYVAGRIGAFVSYTVGDAYPVPKQPGSMIQIGSGVDSSVPPRDVKREVDAAGMPDMTKQGKLNKLRVRSGYYPNILTLGARKTVTPDFKLSFQLSMWGTIEPDDTVGNKPPEFQPANGTRDNSVKADFREGYMQIDGSWGRVMGGRFIAPFARGNTEIDVMYGHGYGAGFPIINRGFGQPAVGDLTLPGPMGGMNGFGLLGATYGAGVTYATPSMAGVKVEVGLFDGASYLTAGWNATRTPRPELELSYDLDTSGFKLHLFGSGAFQKTYSGGSNLDETVWGASYGARVEAGPVRVGGGGFMGSGVGLNWAFDDNASAASPNTMPANQFRNSRGFFGLVQLVFGQLDFGGGFGQTTVVQLPEDKTAAATLSHIKTQTGITAEIGYHLTDNLHLEADFMNGAFKWYGGESQKLNVVNAGVTMTF